jgi:very-short-patch-repair endonuclease
MTVRHAPSSPLPLRERVASGESREPGEGASSYDSNADTPSPALASLGHPLPQGEREEKVGASQTGKRRDARVEARAPRASTPSGARALRRSMTNAERKLWRALRARQIAEAKFRRQVPIGPYVADFLCYEVRLVIEVDGGQHAGSARDEVRDRWLGDNGFRVMRFWNNDVLSNLEGVLATISNELGGSAPREPYCSDLALKGQDNKERVR